MLSFLPMEFKPSNPLDVIPDSPFVEELSKAQEMQQPVYCYYKNRAYRPGNVVCAPASTGGLRVWMCHDNGTWVDEGFTCTYPT